MFKQLLQNRGFENELDSYITQGSVSTNSDIAYSGTKSALLLSTPASIAEISQVVFFISPSSSVKFSFFARRFINEDAENISNIRAEVNFISALGTVIPPGIVITIRGRDISENVWNFYDGYAEVPFGTLAAQVVIRLEPPEIGNSGLLVDDLALSTEVAMPAPTSSPTPQVQQGIPAFPGFPFTPPPPVPVPPVQQGIPTFPGVPFAIPLFPDSPLENTKAEAPGMPNQMDHGDCPSKDSDPPKPGQNEK